jgi:uncharacterized membrane protein
LLLLFPLQLAGPIRRRFPSLHRTVGRIILPVAMVAIVTGIYFGVVIPVAGMVEASAIASVAALFLYSLARGVWAIRRGDVGLHREWMLRAVSVALGISVIRLVAGTLDFLLAPRGLTLSTLFGMSLWLGWILTVVAMEAWIRLTRNAQQEGHEGVIADRPIRAVV